MLIFQAEPRVWFVRQIRADVTGGARLSRSSVVPLNPQARRARARLAAHRRWHPGDDIDALTDECLSELERSRIDDGIDDLIAAAPRMTAEQLARLRRLAAPR